VLCVLHACILRRGRLGGVSIARMPHFVVDCSQAVLDSVSPDSLIRAIDGVASSSGLFRSYDSVKVRVHPFEHYSEAGAATDFIHVMAYVGGLNQNDSGNLADSLIAAVKEQAPSVPIVTAVCLGSQERGE
jgi:5-carboxymethyl-2-hydroxymuconate isomerase